MHKDPISNPNIPDLNIEDTCRSMENVHILLVFLITKPKVRFSRIEVQSCMECCSMYNFSAFLTVYEIILLQVIT